jgi:ribosome-interacting GTPase 1
MDLNMEFLVETIWKNLNLLRVYTKKRGEYPDFEGGLIIRAGSTIEHVVCIIFRAHSPIACLRAVYPPGLCL